MTFLLAAPAAGTPPPRDVVIGQASAASARISAGAAAARYPIEDGSGATVGAAPIFPGDEGARYEQNPGEAFADTFARYRFRDTDVKWAWAPGLRPDAEALRAIREDTLSPWEGRTRIRLAGPARPAGRRGLVRSFCAAPRPPPAAPAGSTSPSAASRAFASSSSPGAAPAAPSRCSSSDPRTPAPPSLR